MKSALSIILLLAALTFGGFLISRMGKSESKYERRAKSPWNSLNDGEDPTS